MLKIFDCSNSSERPPNRGYGGPVVNEFVSHLHTYSSDYNCVFVSDINTADIIFTNDVFPSHVLATNLPRIKRMDGIFWQSNLITRNKKTIESALLADSIIFITEYSKKSFLVLYNDEFNHIKHSSVITHWVSSYNYPKIKHLSSDNRIEFSAMATDWNRPEKRIGELIEFSNKFNVKIHLIGNSNGISLPRNIIPCGYKETPADVYSIMKNTNAFINLTCKDAATKTVCTAINYGLPVLYAGSGGVGELVGNCGIGIPENDTIEVLDYIPSIDPMLMEPSYKNFCETFDDLQHNVNYHEPETRLRKALQSYFDEFNKLI